MEKRGGLCGVLVMRRLASDVLLNPAGIYKIAAWPTAVPLGGWLTASLSGPAAVTRLTVRKGTEQ